MVVVSVAAVVAGVWRPLKRWTSQSLNSAQVPTRLVKLQQDVSSVLEARKTSYAQSNEGESLERPLQATLVDKSWGVEDAIVEIIVLGGENEGREPEVRENPGERGEPSLVRLYGGENLSKQIEE